MAPDFELPTPDRKSQVRLAELCVTRLAIKIPAIVDRRS
jgi:hypothetical protein